MVTAMALPSNQARDNETEEERKVRLEMESLMADEKETRQQVSGLFASLRMSE